MALTMKQVCDELNISYETLRFYCDEGLVPNVKRDANRYRKFDDRDLNWLKSVLCLKRCGMSVKAIKSYMCLCMHGTSTIFERKEILDEQKKKLLEQLAQIQNSINFIDTKQQYYDGVLARNIEYSSNLIDVGRSCLESINHSGV